MAKNKDKERVLAEDLFINQGWTGKAIAELLDLQEKTVSTWRTKFEWDKVRDETLASPTAIRKLILKEIKSITEGNKPTLDADALSKLAKVNDSLGDKISPPVVISVLQMFDDWFAEQEPKKAVEMLEWHKRFILHIINVLG